MQARAGLAEILITLGASGYELSVDPAGDAGDAVLRYRPRQVEHAMAVQLRYYKAEIIALLRTAASARIAPDDEHAVERLAIADELGMSTHVGSAAWLIAVGETLALE